MEFGLCGGCARGLRRQPSPACRLCGVPYSGLANSTAGQPICGSCLRHPPPYEALLVGWIYQPPLDSVLRGLKFHRLEYLAEPLARRLYDRYHLDLEGVRATVAVPLPWWRRAARGFNQAELLARPLAARLGCPLLPLRHRGIRPPQHALGRLGRLLDRRRSFIVPEAVATRLRGRDVLLVDDIVTTGATLFAAAWALKSSGAGRIVALAFGRTPRHPHERHERGANRPFDRP
jgi:ComF family protein